MNQRTKIILIGAIILLVLVALPFLDRRANNAFQRNRELFGEYQQMTNLMARHQESAPSDPVHERFLKSKNLLLENGYIVTKEIRLNQPFTSRRAANTFFHACLKRFPQVEWLLQPKADEPALLTVCARTIDLPTIEKFIADQELAARQADQD